MSTGKRMPLYQARALAERISESIGTGCTKIEIAGSIRRAKPTIGDLEIVAIPAMQGDLFGSPCNSLLEAVLEGLEHEGRLKRLKGSHGGKYKQFELVKSGVKLDLFIVSPETWGVLFLIRTGPAEFSHRLVTQRGKGGLLPDHLNVKDGRIWDGEQALETPEEFDVFAICGMEFIEPKKRT